MALENVITYLVLDVIDHDQTQGVIKAIALDSKTRFVKATLVQHGIDYPVDENATVTLTILRPDNVGVQVTGSVVDVDNADRTGTIKGVYAELTQAALAKSGTLKAQFKMTVGEQILRTEIFQVKNGIALDGETSEWADQYQGYNLDELVQSVNTATANVSAMQSAVDGLKDDVNDVFSVFGVRPTGAYLSSGGNMLPNNRIKYDRFPCEQGDLIYFNLASTDVSFAIKGDYIIYPTPTSNEVTYDSGWITQSGIYEIPHSGYIMPLFAPVIDTNAFSAATDCDECAVYCPPDIYGKVKSINGIKRVTADTTVPILRNGSAGNYGNANAVCSEYVEAINHNYDKIVVEYLGDTSLADEYAFAYTMFYGASDGMTTTACILDSSVGKKYVNSVPDQFINIPYIIIDVDDISAYDHISFHVWRRKDGAYVPLRIADNQYCLKITYMRDIELSDNLVAHELVMARHVAGGSITPLTILHFSDLHKDINALNRIVADSKRLSVDDMICTGDMASNTSEQISGWWNKEVMTCIGNHDTASYAANTGYNWTALSMADRDAYYISPFKSYWNVIHTSGKSYYYKDYTEQKVRLIVMDGMLYTNNGSEATAQTTWLASLLEDAISNDLHVLIAIHAPHGGASAVDCSFSRYEQTAMPVLSDCNTPDAVIDAVANAKRSGLKFVGYIVGHTHQDNVWDAVGDGSQLMYCVTCGNTFQKAQWINSDQDRTSTDAYNLVTIDTAHTLVKIVRGGGADIDDHMRTRKAICFDYSTGQKVGEVM